MRYKRVLGKYYTYITTCLAGLFACLVGTEETLAILGTVIGVVVIAGVSYYVVSTGGIELVLVRISQTFAV